MLIKFKELVERYKIPVTGIIHLGANLGQEAGQYDEMGFDRVLWVEAIPSVYDQLIGEVVIVHPFHSAINACLSDEGGREVKFNISSNGGESSSMLEFGTHAVAHPDVTFVSHLSLITQRFDVLAYDHKIVLDEYKFMNLDLQGAELLALKGCGDILKGIDYIYCEVNEKELYVGCALIGEIDSYLSGFGFKRIETKMAGDAGWGDALYIKNKLT